MYEGLHVDSRLQVIQGQRRRKDVLARVRSSAAVLVD